MRSAVPRQLAQLVVVALTVVIAGCATPVLESTVAVPDHYATATASADEPDVAWWEAFGDPVLAGLIDRAARENRDVRIALVRVRAARAGETISRSWLLPSIGGVGGAIDQHTNYGFPANQALPDLKAYGGGLSVNWEIDLAGGLRAGAAAAAADVVASEADARGVRLLVMSDVATNYFMLVGALRQLETVREISAAQDETLRLVTARRRAGLATPFDVERAQTAAASARAAIPPLETLAAASRHRIAVLIGDQAANAATIAPWQGVATVPETRSGQPATLLERRPDLLAAKAELDAANARRRQAQAEWFPRLFLSALFGGGSSQLNGVSLGGSPYVNTVALLAMPIFNAGRTQAINDIADSKQQAAALHYEDAIVRALADVETALVALGDERTRAQSLRDAATSADAAFGRAKSLYDRGQIDLLPLLDAQRARLAVRLGSNDSDTQVLLDSVQLFKALGGGWQAFEPPAKSAAVSAGATPKS